MRIALVLYAYSATRGGVERVVWNLSRGLSERGHEVHVVCHRRDADGETGGVAVHVVPATEWSSALRYASFARNVEAFFRDRDDDVVQGFGRTYGHDIVRVGGGAHWEYLCRTHPSMRTAFGRLVRRLNPRDRAILALERRCYAPGTYRRVVCVSRRVRDEVKRYFGVPDEALVVIPNGVDIRRFHPDDRAARRIASRGRIGLRDGDLAVLFAGSGFDRKGLSHALGACARLFPLAPVRLLIAGRDAPGPYERRARALGIVDRVSFLGETSAIESLYAAADVFLLPTLYDPFPNTCLEAMACGLPVVTTAVTGVAEILTTGTDGFVVDSGDQEEALAETLRILTDPGRRESVGRAARVTAEHHSLDVFLDRSLALYELVAALKRGAPPGEGRKE